VMSGGNIVRVMDVVADDREKRTKISMMEMEQENRKEREAKE